MKSKALYITCCFSIIFSLGEVSADTFRQSNGVGKLSLDLSFEKYDIDNIKQTKSNSGPTTSAWNQMYTAPVERDLLVLRASYGVFEKMDIFAGIGFADETWDARRKDNGLDIATQSGKDSIFELGLKGTAVKFNEDRFHLSYLAKYSRLKTGDHYKGVPSPTDSTEVVWTTYDVDLELAYKCDSYGISPYIGVNYFNLKAEQNLDDGKWEYKNTSDVAYLFGVNKKINDQIGLNIEGTTGAKKGLRLGINYDF